MQNFHNFIYVQTLPFFPINFWKNILSQMLFILVDNKICQFKDLYLELILVRDREIMIYNQEYLNCHGPTNILSFPHVDNMAFVQEKPKQIKTYSNLGSLILSIDTLDREIKLYGQKPEVHVTRLLAHGLVHLLGYDHGQEMDYIVDIIEKETDLTNVNYTPIWSYLNV